MVNTHKTQIDLEVNGQVRQLDADHRWTLLHVLRNELDMTGTKRGCDRGECGACTVLVDGKPVYSCQMLALQVGNRSIQTVEGLGESDMLTLLQQAFLDNDGGQCGFCTPGFVMSAQALLDANTNVSEDEIRRAISGNICRCNAYGRILESIKEAVRLHSIG